MAGQRLDMLLVARGLAASREHACALIMAGQVFVGEELVTKAGTSVSQTAQIQLREPDHPYVSRGGVKLAGALDTFCVSPKDATCLDVGASTGGFTDVLLRRGAKRVYAVDVGYCLLEARLRENSRVVLVERTNVRKLGAAQVPEPIDLATIDVSFISLKLVLPVVQSLMRPGGQILALVKPQFEVGRGQTNKGVVRDETLRLSAVQGVVDFAQTLGLGLSGQCDSSIRGPKGNLERFILLSCVSS